MNQQRDKSPLPCDQERLIEVVVDVHYNVIVRRGVDVGAGELSIDEDALLGDTERGDGAVRHIPSEENVRIFRPNHRSPHREAQ